EREVEQRGCREVVRRLDALPGADVIEVPRALAIEAREASHGARAHGGKRIQLFELFRLVGTIDRRARELLAREIRSLVLGAVRKNRTGADHEGRAPRVCTKDPISLSGSECGIEVRSRRALVQLGGRGEAEGVRHRVEVRVICTRSKWIAIGAVSAGL